MLLSDRTMWCLNFASILIHYNSPLSQHIIVQNQHHTVEPLYNTTFSSSYARLLRKINNSYIKWILLPSSSIQPSLHTSAFKHYKLQNVFNPQMIFPALNALLCTIFIHTLRFYKFNAIIGIQWVGFIFRLFTSNEICVC